MEYKWDSLAGVGCTHRIAMNASMGGWSGKFCCGYLMLEQIWKGEEDDKKKGLNSLVVCSFVESDLMRGDATSARVYAVSRRHSIESLSKLNMHRAQARAVNRCWASSVDFWFLGTWPNIVNAPSSLNAIHFRVVLRRVWKFAWFAVIYSKSFIFVMEFERQNSLG